MIKFQNVSFTYDGDEENNSISHVNISINKGEVVLFCGPSGSGKSTLIRMVNGLIPHFYGGHMEGKVTIDGKSVAEYPLYDSVRNTGTVFQNPRAQFFNVDTTSELAFSCENMGMPEEDIRTRVNMVVSECKIEELMGRSIFKLSGGEKQRIACASVMVGDPEIVILDEPSANLDYRAVENLRKVIDIWRMKGKTILVAEHRLAYLMDFVDRVIVMDRGSIIRDLTIGEFLDIPKEDKMALGLRTLHHQDPDSIKMERHHSEKLVLKDMIFSNKGRKKVLDIDNMKLSMGEITAITGDNGCGKSTFLNCVCGLERKCKGVLEYKGKQYKNKDRNNLIYMVMQDVNHQLFTESVLDEVLISMKKPDEGKALSILERLDLRDYAHRHPLSLSGGQKQRVAIATALASDRDILLFDEPTSGLDYRHMLEVSDTLKELKNMGKTVLVVTHDPELINCCCSEVVHLKDFKA